MKYKQVIVSLFIIMLSTSVLFSGENETRYLTGFVKNVDDNLITLTNNLVWRADQHVTAISMTPFVIILQKDKNEGYLYIKGKRVNVTLMQAVDNFGGKQMYTPALNDKLNTYNVGELTEIEKIDIGTGKLYLTNGTTWDVKTDDDKDVLKNWDVNTEVIVTKNSSTTIITNVVTTDRVNVKQMNKTASDKSAN